MSRVERTNMSGWRTMKMISCHWLIKILASRKVWLPGVFNWDTSRIKIEEKVNGMSYLPLHNRVKSNQAVYLCHSLTLINYNGTRRHTSINYFWEWKYWELKTLISDSILMTRIRKNTSRNLKYVVVKDTKLFSQNIRNRNCAVGIIKQSTFR